MNNTVVIIGASNGKYENEEIQKEFSCKALVMVRPNGSLVVQNLSEGIRPICYIGEGAKIQGPMTSNISKETTLIAETEDGQKLTLKFDEVYGLVNVPEEEYENVPCKKCGCEDTPLHYDGLCPDCFKEPDRESEMQEQAEERQREQRKDHDSHRAANAADGFK